MHPFPKVDDSVQAAVDRDEEKAATKERSLRAKVVSALAMQGEANQLSKKLTLQYWNEYVVAKGTTLKGQVCTCMHACSSHNPYTCVHA